MSKTLTGPAAEQGRDNKPVAPTAIRPEGMGVERIILRIILYMAFAYSLAAAVVHTGGLAGVCAVVALAGLACSAK